MLFPKWELQLPLGSVFSQKDVVSSIQGHMLILEILQLV